MRFPLKKTADKKRNYFNLFFTITFLLFTNGITAFASHWSIREDSDFSPPPRQMTLTEQLQLLKGKLEILPLSQSRIHELVESSNIEADDSSLLSTVALESRKQHLSQFLSLLEIELGLTPEVFEPIKNTAQTSGSLSPHSLNFYSWFGTVLVYSNQKFSWNRPEFYDYLPFTSRLLNIVVVSQSIVPQLALWNQESQAFIQGTHKAIHLITTTAQYHLLHRLISQPFVFRVLKNEIELAPISFQKKKGLIAELQRVIEFSNKYYVTARLATEFRTLIFDSLAKEEISSWWTPAEDLQLKETKKELALGGQPGNENLKTNLVSHAEFEHLKNLKKQKACLKSLRSRL